MLRKDVWTTSQLIKNSNKLRLSWAKLQISLVGVGDVVKVDITVEVTTCPGWVKCVGGGTNDNIAKSALTKVELKV